jgi:hypothetical protein
MIARLEQALKEADYRVEDVSKGRDMGFGLVAYSDHLGRRRKHYIQIKALRRGLACRTGGSTATTPSSRRPSA